MGLSGFEIRPVSGPEIADLGDLNGPKPLRNPSKMVGRFAPHHFGWALKRFRADEIPQHRRFQVKQKRPDVKTRQSHFQTYLMLQS